MRPTERCPGCNEYRYVGDRCGNPECGGEAKGPYCMKTYMIDARIQVEVVDEEDGIVVADVRARVRRGKADLALKEQKEDG